MFAEDLPDSPVRRLVAIERDRTGQSALDFERPPEKGLRRGDIPVRPQQEIDRLSVAIDSAIEIGPATFDLDVSFVDPPGTANFAGKAVPSLFELGNIALKPTHNRGVRQSDASFSHHLDQIPEAQLKSEIPPNTDNNDLLIKMTALEEIVDAQHAGPPS